jgi:hypothetical protein
MRRALERYFRAERKGSVLLVLLGAAAVAVSVALWKDKSPLASLGWPLTALGLIEFAAGAGILLRTGRQVADLRHKLAREPSSFRIAELARMERVILAFHRYRAAEWAFLIGGGALVAVFRRKTAPTAFGFGLALQALLLLLLDGVAKKRAEHYVDAIITTLMD